jgi:hypothetical protein
MNVSEINQHTIYCLKTDAVNKLKIIYRLSTSLKPPRCSFLIKSFQETDLKKSRFSPSQIICILKADAGTKVDDNGCKHAIGNAAYYVWPSKYGGMEASDNKRMRELKEKIVNSNRC